MMILPDIATEDRLLANARRGNRDAVMRIYDQYFSPIYNYIRLRVDDRTTAEDLASEVFVRFIDSLRGNNPPQHSLRGWLFQVARYAISDHYGTMRKVRVEALNDWLPVSDNPEAQVAHLSDMESVHHALNMLVDEQREVLILRFVEMLNLKETADVMGKSVSAIKSLQFRALETLRHILDGRAADD